MFRENGSSVIRLRLGGRTGGRTGEDSACGEDSVFVEEEDVWV